MKGRDHWVDISVVGIGGIARGVGVSGSFAPGGKVNILNKNAIFCAQKCLNYRDEINGKS
jgi:hypothetical protein